jgi:hypothetical protein
VAPNALLARTVTLALSVAAMPPLLVPSVLAPLSLLMVPAVRLATSPQQQQQLLPPPQSLLQAQLNLLREWLSHDRIYSVFLTPIQCCR